MDQTNKIKNTKLVVRLLDTIKKSLSIDSSLTADATLSDFFQTGDISRNNIIVVPTITAEVIDISSNQPRSMVMLPPFTKSLIDCIDAHSKKYKLIFSSMPLGAGQIDWDDYKLPAEYVYTLRLLKNLEEGGILVALLPPIVLSSGKGNEFEKKLNSLGYYFSGVFNLPKSFLAPYTSLRPVLLLIKKGMSDGLFISELDYLTDFETPVKNYLENSSGSMEDGVFVKRNDFTSFDNYKTTQQISRLQTQYKSYKESSLEEIALTVNATTENFNDIENSLYIPRIGSSAPVSSLEETTIKHKNYFQVVLKKEIVDAQYLAVFFKSQMGILTLESLKKITFIPHVNKSDLLKIRLPVPNLETQKIVTETSKKINQVKDAISSFESQLSLNPDSANKIQGVLNSALQALGKLNEEDQILELIRQGESKTIEFKQTFSKDVDTNIKEKEKSIRESSLKNIVAFLNSEGGTLLIGVKDDGQIYGIENDNYENDDRFLLNFKNNIKEHIGEEAYPFIDWKIILVGNKRVLRVDCKISTKPSYLNRTDFYVRTNPSADKLVGPELAEYLHERFYK